MTSVFQQPEDIVGGSSEESQPENLVVLAQSCRPDYEELATPVPAPELPDGRVGTNAAAAVRELFQVWGLDASHFGSSRWNPLGAFILPGSTVVLKPNWVL